MIFAVDIGNTNITAGIILNRKVSNSWRLSTHPNRTADEYSFLISHLITSTQYSVSKISSAVISSVVPQMTDSVRTALRQLLHIEPFVVQPGICLNFNIHYTKPQDVGADRIVNAVAAKILFGYPLLILDFGTATTFCVLDKEGDYSGGVIFPGIHTISSALSSSTALLPHVAFQNPGRIIGNSTQTSIQSGLFYGYLDMIEGMIQRILLEVGKNTKVVVTGGLAGLFRSLSSYIDIHEPDLTLIGLEMILEMNGMQSSKELKVWEPI